MEAPRIKYVTSDEVDALYEEFKQKLLGSNLVPSIENTAALYANHLIIARRNKATLYRKMQDTLEFLDREIKTLRFAASGTGAEHIDRLEELHDDLVETLRKIDEG